MNLCKDCKHMAAAAIPFGSDIPMCIHPSAPVDPVYGRKNASCDLMRSANCLVKPACSPAGDWFEQAPEPKPVAVIKPYAIEMVGTESRVSFWDRVRRWLD